MRRIPLLLLLLLIAAGCSSVRSTMLHRGELDQGWETERPLPGVPVTVYVPTHVKLEVVEHRYLGLVDVEVQDDGTEDETSGRIEWLDAESIDVPLRSVRHELIKTARIFTVDPKRPAAGTMDATLKFGGVNGQYFDQIDYFAEDETVDAITGLIGQVAPSGLLGVPTAGRDEESDVEAYLQRVDTVVASAMFNLDAPDLELQMAQFMEMHLNACHTCQIVPPGVDLPQRLPSVVVEPCSPHFAAGCAPCQRND